MTGKENRNSIQRTARVAGFLYLMLFPAAFGLIYIPSRLFVSGDAAATGSKIMASERLFRLGIVSNLCTSVISILVVLALYRLLKSINKGMASLMVIFSLTAVPIWMLSEITQLAALHLLSGADYLKAFTTGQLQALALLSLNLHEQGINVAQIFWGLWLFPLGYLVIKSRFLPGILGILLIIGCFGYVIQSLAAFLWPHFKLSIGLFTGWGELLFPLWLLIKGVNVEQWKKRTAESG
jgi:hypothetical protein